MSYTDVLRLLNERVNGLKHCPHPHLGVPPRTFFPGYHYLNAKKLANDVNFGLGLGLRLGSGLGLKLGISLTSFNQF